MALFSNKEDKGSKAEALLEKYGLQELKDPRDLESVRQIARALVGDPEILILDDSASALDLATDAALRKAALSYGRSEVCRRAGAQFL